MATEAPVVASVQVVVPLDVEAVAVTVATASDTTVTSPSTVVPATPEGTNTGAVVPHAVPTPVKVRNARDSAVHRGGVDGDRGRGLDVGERAGEPDGAEGDLRG